MGGRKVWLLLYADDAAVMAEDEKEMEERIKEMKRYMRKKEQEVNLEKAKIMIQYKNK